MRLRILGIVTVLIAGSFIVGCNSLDDLQTNIKTTLNLNTPDDNFHNFNKFLDDYTAQARQGDSECQLNLGQMYLEGELTPSQKQEIKDKYGLEPPYPVTINRDLKAAKDWFEDAIKAKNPEAMAFYAQTAFYGNELNISPNRCVLLAQESASLGSAFGKAILGECFYRGFGVDQSYSKAFEYFQESQEHPHSKVMLSNMYLFGYLVTQDPALAQSLALQALEQGDISANVPLAEQFYQGIGVEKDLNKALQYMIDYLAQNPNDYRSVLWTAKILIDASTYDEKYEAPVTQALLKLTQLDDKYYQGYAYYALGSLTFMHRSTQPEFKFFEYLNKAIELGVPEAKDELTKIQKQFKTWQAQADQGEQSACALMVYYYYLFGDNGTPDPNKAINYARELVGQNHPFGYCFMAYQYFHGRYLNRSESLALNLMYKAADQGFNIAQDFVTQYEKLSKELPRAKLEEAESLLFEQVLKQLLRL